MVTKYVFNLVGYMKNKIVIILTLFIFSCHYDSHKDSIIKNALLEVIDKHIVGLVKKDFVLFDEFSKNINDSILYKYLHGLYISNKDTFYFLDDSNLKYIINQNNSLKDKPVSNYYKNSKIKYSYSIRDSNKYSVLLSPPLFTIDEKYFVINVLIFIKNNNSFSGYERFWIYKRDNNDWILYSFIKIEH